MYKFEVGRPAGFLGEVLRERADGAAGAIVPGWELFHCFCLVSRRDLRLDRAAAAVGARKQKAKSRAILAGT